MKMMKVYTAEDKIEIQERIVKILKDKQEIFFTYLHGSFLEDYFRDIDIAIYLDEVKSRRDTLKYELTLESLLEEAVGLPVDLRVLNSAPLSFKFKVVKGGRLP